MVDVHYCPPKEGRDGEIPAPRETKNPQHLALQKGAADLWNCDMLCCRMPYFISTLRPFWM